MIERQFDGSLADFFNYFSAFGVSQKLAATLKYDAFAMEFGADGLTMFG